LSAGQVARSYSLILAIFYAESAFQSPEPAGTSGVFGLQGLPVLANQAGKPGRHADILVHRIAVVVFANDPFAGHIGHCRLDFIEGRRNQVRNQPLGRYIGV